MIKYLFNNWKLIIHLLFRTYHFGVDNQWDSQVSSIFGKPVNQRYNLLRNYREMRTRAFLGFIPLNTAIKLFPFYAKRHGYK